MKKYFAALAIVGLLAGNGFAYGGRGHRIVGAIADRRLAKAQNDTVNKKLKKLLDGMTLEEVATLPDNIKDWDPKKDDPNNPPREPFSVKGHPLIEAQLRAFVNANPTSAKPSHHEFHYTDVSVFAGEKYGDGTVGRAKFDIVQMIPFAFVFARQDSREEQVRYHQDRRRDPFGALPGRHSSTASRGRRVL